MFHWLGTFWRRERTDHKALEDAAREALALLRVCGQEHHPVALTLARVVPPAGPLQSGKA